VILKGGCGCIIQPPHQPGIAADRGSPAGRGPWRTPLKSAGCCLALDNREQGARRAGPGVSGFLAVRGSQRVGADPPLGFGVELVRGRLRSHSPARCGSGWRSHGIRGGLILQGRFRFQRLSAGPRRSRIASGVLRGSAETQQFDTESWWNWRCDRLGALVAKHFGRVYQKALGPLVEQFRAAALRGTTEAVPSGRQLQWRAGPGLRSCTFLLPHHIGCWCPIAAGRKASVASSRGVRISARHSPMELACGPRPQPCCQIAVCSGAGRPCPEGSAGLSTARHPGQLPAQFGGSTGASRSWLRGPASGPRGGPAENRDRALKARCAGEWRLPAQLCWARGSPAALERVVLGQGSRVKSSDGIRFRSRTSSASWRIVNSPGLPMLIGPEVLPVHKRSALRRDHRRKQKAAVWLPSHVECKRGSPAAPGR